MRRLPLALLALTIAGCGTSDLSPPAAGDTLTTPATTPAPTTSSPDPTPSATSTATMTPSISVCDATTVRRTLDQIGQATASKIFDPGNAITRRWQKSFKAGLKLAEGADTRSALRRGVKAVDAYQAIAHGSIASRNHARTIAQAAADLADACGVDYEIRVPRIAKPPKPKPVEKNDPRFSSCGDANDAGYGPYRRGVDPEYSWYQDRDGDGVVCEPR